MNYKDALEAEDLFSKLEKYKYVMPQVARLREIFMPMVENEKEKQMRKDKNIHRSWNKYTPHVEVQRAATALANAITFYEEAEKEISSWQRETQDILHALELTDMNDEEMTELMKELKEIRIHRRVAKNFVEVLEPFYNYAKDNKSIIKELGKVQNEVSKLNESIDNRKYKVREKITLRDRFENADELNKRVLAFSKMNTIGAMG